MYIGFAFNNTICKGWFNTNEIYTALYKNWGGEMSE